MTDESPEELLVSTPAFTGELSKLLRLVRKREIDIMLLTLATISRQVVEALDRLSIDTRRDEERRRAVADGAVLASQLVLQKTRAILGLKEEDPLDGELEAQDVERQELVEAQRRALEQLARLLEQRTPTFVVRGNEMQIAEASAPEEEESELDARPYGDLGSDDEAELEAAAHTMVSVDLYPQKEMSAEILALLADGDAGASLESFRDSDPARLISAFLAVLELLKSRVVSARQARIHDEILLERARV